jgi:hypothetical protein
MKSQATRAGAVGAFLIGLYAVVFRRLQLEWGATTEEARSGLPGDDLLPNADLIATRCIRIMAAPEQVWPWIAQIGQGRGGFYSYDSLENLVGCDIHSADRIDPEWQHPDVGDEVRLHPEVALAVALVQPGNALVLRGAVPVGGTQGDAPYDFSWAFVVRDGTDGSTQALVRERYLCTRWWAALLVEPVSVVSFVMSQRMLRGIKERAEHGSVDPATGRTGVPPPPGRTGGSTQN